MSQLALPLVRHPGRPKKGEPPHPGGRCASCRSRTPLLENKRCQHCIDRAPFWRRKWAYGISEAQYNVILQAQGGGCAICGTPRGLCVDHDHATGAIRGLLCHACNRGLGAFRDDRERMRAALAYLG